MVKCIHDDLNIIGVIHARGGSKRIPLKNIKPLGGLPLISYIINAAKESKYLRRVIVSTDHPEIKRISLELDVEVPFDRPKELAEDCPSEWVTQHAVRFIEDQELRSVDIAVTMQPTTPFCLSSDIDRCIDILLSSQGLNSVFSAKTVHERPEWMFMVHEDFRGEPFIAGEMKGERGVFQSLQKLVIPNGAVYATRRSSLFDEGVIISKKTGVHVMPPERSIDIDEPIDFLFAELFISRMRSTPTP